MLNGDYFGVPDESIKQLRSVLTIVGGRIVRDAIREDARRSAGSH